MSQGAMQQHQLQAINGDTMPGHGNIHISSPLESAAASNIPTTNSNRSVMVPSNYSKQEFWEMKSLHFKVLWLSFNCQVENFFNSFCFPDRLQERSGGEFATSSAPGGSAT